MKISPVTFIQQLPTGERKSRAISNNAKKNSFGLKKTNFKTYDSLPKASIIGM
jgi:hypothetical protein